MPTYEYLCERCSHQFEEFQSITARPLAVCPSCKRRTLRRLIGTGAGVIFKGSGFYQTDYRSESYKKAAEAEKPKTEGKVGEGKAAGAAGPAKKESGGATESKSSKGGGKGKG